MAEGPGRSRTVEYERRSSRRKKRVATDDLKKDIPTEIASSVSNETTDEPSLPECAVCLQTCVYPARLPCSHIFCYLCLKGIVNQSRRCAMCRQDIPPDYLEHPDLVQVPSVLSDKSNTINDSNENDNTEGSYQWFYEGRNGWWQYDERTSRELETSYKQGDRSCELLIAGFLYMADFNSMMQMRKNEPSRYRRMKRDVSTIARKGIAGIRTFATATDNIIDQMNSLSISTSQGNEESGTESFSAIPQMSPSQATSDSSLQNDN